MNKSLKRLFLVCLLVILVQGSIFGQENTSTELVFLSDYDGGSLQLYSVKSDNTGFRYLTNTLGDLSTRDVLDATCSPDSTKVYFAIVRGIYRINRDGSNLVNVLRDGVFNTLAISYSGTKIAYSRVASNGFYQIFTANVDGTNEAQVTNNNYTSWYPSWSPDGTKIAFAFSENSENGIATVNTNGSGRIELTRRLGTENYPSWSPDAQRIAFTSNRTGVHNIFTIQANGTNLLQLTSGAGNNSRPQWSPDGQSISFNSDRHGNGNEIYIMNADGTNQQRITNNNSNDLNICWLTPFPQNTGTGLRGQYYDTADVTTGLKFYRINPTINFNWASTSPDTAIAADTFSIRWTGKIEPLYTQTYTFYVTHNDGARLWVNGVQLINDWVNRTTAIERSGTITLAAGVKYDIKLEYYDNTAAASVKLEWSSPSQARQVIPASQLYAPEGQLTFTGTTSGNADVFIRNPDGTGEINLSNHATQDNYSAWSPDGTKLAFVSTRDGNEEIYMVNADGTGLRRLTNHASSDVQPAWSADGTKIAFTSYRTTGGRLYYMTITGTGIPAVTRLTNLAHPESNPMWSPNGMKLVYEANVTNNVEIYVVNYTGTAQTPQRITARSGIDAAPFLAPDGLRIAFRAPDPVSGIDQIWIANTTSPYNLRKVTSLGANYFESWSPDGTKILFMSTRTGNADIFTMDAATQATEGQNQTNLTNNAANESYAVWSPDARQIAFVRSGDIYLMNRDGTNQRNITNTPTRTEIEIVWWQTKQAR